MLALPKMSSHFMCGLNAMMDLAEESPSLIVGISSAFSFLSKFRHFILPTESEKRGVLKVGSIPVAILPSGQDKKNTFVL